jgi:NAD(P)-dependent dehydrogenase (short-subunit alcohol dehydrogenase family)
LLQRSRPRDGDRARAPRTRGHRDGSNPETLVDLPAAARLALDVTDAESVRGVAEAAGTVDVLVNNAAEIAIGPLESIPFAEVRRLYEINVLGTLRMIQAFAPGMRARRAGTIMNVSSS